MAMHLLVWELTGPPSRKNKIPNYQNGFIYLTSHRACYVDNDEPKKYSVAVELKDVDRTESWVRFLAHIFFFSFLL